MTTRTTARRGMTLAEVMIALVLIAIVGAMFTKMLVAQGRFYNSQYAQRTARSVARAPMNLLLSELRMVQDQGGVAAAAADGKRVRLKVPYRFGVVCATTGGATVASMLPADSSVSATYAGWSWRASDGSYTEVAAADAPDVCWSCARPARPPGCSRRCSSGSTSRTSSSRRRRTRGGSGCIPH